MSDRLAELVRQRALVQEHLAWLNREIAAAAEAAKPAPVPDGPTTAGSPASEATTPSPSIPTATRPAGAAPVLPVAPPAAAAVDPDEIIARYQVAPTAMKQDLRKGCLLYFAGAFILLGLIITILYLTLTPKR